MKQKTVYVVQFTHSINEPYCWEDCDNGEHETDVSAISHLETYWQPYFGLTKFRVIRRITADPIEDVIV